MRIYKYSVNGYQRAVAEDELQNFLKEYPDAQPVTLKSTGTSYIEVSPVTKDGAFYYNVPNTDISFKRSTEQKGNGFYTPGEIVRPTPDTVLPQNIVSKEADVANKAIDVTVHPPLTVKNVVNEFKVGSSNIARQTLATINEIVTMPFKAALNNLTPEQYKTLGINEPLTQEQINSITENAYNNALSPLKKLDNLIKTNTPETKVSPVDIRDMIKKGEYGDAGKQVAFLMIQNVPQIAGLFFGEKAFNTIMGAASAGQVIQEDKASGKNPDLTKAAINGIIEVLGNEIGLNAIFKRATQAERKASAMGFSDAIKKIFLNTREDMAQEGVSEALTQLGQNINQNGNNDLGAGVIESTLTGAFMGALAGGSGKILNKILSKTKNANAVENTAQENVDNTEQEVSPVPEQNTTQETPVEQQQQTVAPEVKKTNKEEIIAAVNDAEANTDITNLYELRSNVIKNIDEFSPQELKDVTDKLDTLASLSPEESVPENLLSKNEIIAEINKAPEDINTADIPMLWKSIEKNVYRFTPEELQNVMEKIDVLNSIYKGNIKSGELLSNPEIKNINEVNNENTPPVPDKEGTKTGDVGFDKQGLIADIKLAADNNKYNEFPVLLERVKKNVNDFDVKDLIGINPLMGKLETAYNANNPPKGEATTDIKTLKKTETEINTAQREVIPNAENLSINQVKYPIMRASEVLNEGYSPDALETVNAVVKAFSGQPPIFIKAKDIKGIYHGGQVFLNPQTINNSRDMLGTAMHEIVHYIKNNSPEIYKDIISEFKSNVKIGKSLENKVRDAYRDEYKNEDQFKTLLYDETLAEYAAERSKSPEFWEKLSHKDMNVVLRILMKIQDVIRSVTSGFKNTYSDMLKDMQKMEDALIEGLSRQLKKMNPEDITLTQDTAMYNLFNQSWQDLFEEAKARTEDNFNAKNDATRKKLEDEYNSLYKRLQEYDEYNEFEDIDISKLPNDELERLTRRLASFVRTEGYGPLLSEKNVVRRFVRDFSLLFMGKENTAKEMLRSAKSRNKLDFDSDFFGAEDLGSGKANYEAKEIKNTAIKIIHDFAHETKLSYNDLVAFMYAQHAPEANEAIARKYKLDTKTDEVTDSDVLHYKEWIEDNERLTGVEKKALLKKFKNIDAIKKMLYARKHYGSGMTSEEASSYLNNLTKEKKEALSKWAQIWRDKIVSPTLEMKHDAEILSDKSYDNIKNSYKYYIPLKSYIPEEQYKSDLISSSKGVFKTGIKERGGRLTLADDPLAFSLLDHQKTIRQIHENQSKKALYNFIKDNPSPDDYTIDSIVKLKNAEEGDVPIEAGRKEYEVYKVDNPKTGRLEKVLYLHCFVHGEKIGIKITNPDLIDMYKRFYPKGLWAKALKLISWDANIFRKLTTQYNIEFPAFNHLMDVPFALSKIMATMPASFSKDFIKNNTLLWMSKSEYDKWVKKLMEEGGYQGWDKREDFEIIQKELTTALNNAGKASTIRELGENFAKTFNAFSDRFENQTRVAVYKSAVEGGIDPRTAARFARGFTLNFNLGGVFKQLLNTFYVFSNANIQSIRSFAEMFSSEPYGYMAGDLPFNSKMGKHVNRKAVAFVTALTAAGMVSRFLAWMYLDDDGRKKIKAVSDYNKDRSILIPTDRKGTHFIIVPTGYIINIFPALGGIIAEMALGMETPSKGFIRWINSLTMAINPLNGSLTDVQTYVPTHLLKTLYQMKMNTDWMGNKIYPEGDFVKKKPMSERYYQTVSSTSKEVTRWLNQMTGGRHDKKGNSITSGMIDINPELLDYFFQTYFSSVGRQALNLVDLTKDTVINHKVPDTYLIPWVHRIMATPSGKTSLGAIYSLVDQSYTKLLSKEEENKLYELIDIVKKDSNLESTKRKSVLNAFEKYKQNKKRLLKAEE